MLLHSKSSGSPAGADPQGSLARIRTIAWMLVRDGGISSRWFSRVKLCAAGFWGATLVILGFVAFEAKESLEEKRSRYSLISHHIACVRAQGFGVQLFAALAHELMAESRPIVCTNVARTDIGLRRRAHEMSGELAEFRGLRRMLLLRFRE